MVVRFQLCCFLVQETLIFSDACEVCVLRWLEREVARNENNVLLHIQEQLFYLFLFLNDRQQQFSSVGFVN